MCHTHAGLSYSCCHTHAGLLFSVRPLGGACLQNAKGEEEADVLP